MASKAERFPATALESLCSFILVLARKKTALVESFWDKSTTLAGRETALTINSNKSQCNFSNHITNINASTSSCIFLLTNPIVSRKALWVLKTFIIRPKLNSNLHFYWITRIRFYNLQKKKQLSKIFLCLILEWNTKVVSSHWKAYFQCTISYHVSIYQSQIKFKIMFSPNSLRKLRDSSQNALIYLSQHFQKKKKITRNCNFSVGNLKSAHTQCWVLSPTQGRKIKKTSDWDRTCCCGPLWANGQWMA